MIVIDHTHPMIQRTHRKHPQNRYNGGVYYSKEIGQYFIPTIKTQRNWVTMNVKSVVLDNAIVFVHNNIHIEWYEKYKGLDVVLVCGLPETVEKVKPFGKAVYLPLSIDTRYVKQFKTQQTKGVCFVGRAEKKTPRIPEGVDMLEGMPRPRLLTELAKYKRAYAVDRCAIECKCLNVDVLPYGYGYGIEHPPEFWKVLDSRDAAKMLQSILDDIDGCQ